MTHQPHPGERRVALIEKIAQQRSDLGALSHQFDRPAALFDKGRAIARGIGSHPKLTMAFGVAAVFLLRRHIAFGKAAGIALTAARLGITLAKILRK